MKADDLKRRVTIQRATATRNDFNEDVQSWLDVATVWAHRIDVLDGEKIAAGQLGSFLQSRFTVRASPVTEGITPSDRLFHEGRVWQIIAPPKERSKYRQGGEVTPHFLEITAVRDAD